MLRATVASGVSTGFALAFHVAGGAPVPGLLGIAVPFVLAALASSLLMSRRPRLLTTVVATSLAQVAFHTLFVLGSTSTVTSAAAASPAAGVHAGHGSMAMASGTATPDVALALHGDARMWLMHGAAAVVTALMLQRGELLLGLLLRLADAVVAAVAPHLPAATLVRPRRTPTVRPLDRPHPLHDRVVATARRRGPPHLLAA
ncbi:putative integral membrane protein [Serinibacter arcticus]|uniref:Putative integral membrane protein n=1 Tax=Serinibacter arcticus TaxID=1655435 RepID=A0A4Z1E1C1_9MICO|nr:putative integral membrane protein [Serinibacter arcticus]